MKPNKRAASCILCRMGGELATDGGRSVHMLTV
eukprot:CAMPEP_0204295508 /NCGR_PEP_ID=MMETSP0468-20130131/69810_1 /ASSEMBLY_ACC=CAM_ASM_000383 /TAXON_ID=2969 /ORGANISM="Oxyrrhis marina" /LENGTH=32 /DNA_ID= /DNA_START= /DNA_END= /DNA_ORIENTATION=